MHDQTSQPWRALPFAQSLVVWGYDLSGNAAEPSALVTENPTLAAWDNDADYLSRFDRWHGGRQMPVPDWWALPFVVKAEVAAA